MLLGDTNQQIRCLCILATLPIVTVERFIVVTFWSFAAVCGFGDNMNSVVVVKFWSLVALYGVGDNMNSAVVVRFWFSPLCMALVII